MQNIAKEVEFAIAEIRSGHWWVKNGKTKHLRNKFGYERICGGTADLKRLADQLGRAKKKEKRLKKKYKVQTLTECFGIPWRILTLREQNNSQT